MSLATRLLSFERRLYTTLRFRADRRLARLEVAAGDRPLPEHLLTGQRGENEAWFHLRSLGYTVVARRWRAARLRGDLDLLAWDGDTLVVFEVKTRTARDFAPAESSVDRHKRNQLRAQVRAYLRHIPDPFRSDTPVRFDILSVYLLPSGTVFEHFPAAFPLVAPPEDRPHPR